MNNCEISIALQTNKPISDYGPIARQIENLGFDGLSVYNDMLYQPAWLPLLEITRNTEKIRIGPASVNPFTCHPINIAGNIALIDEYSNGRAYLGLARGAWLDYIGLKPKNPIRALKEAMECIRHLLKQSKRAFKGIFFSLEGGDSLRWNILRERIPFLLGSWGPKTIQACIHEISEIKLGGTANSDVIPWIRSVIKKATGKINRDVSEIGLTIGAVSVVDQDGDKARDLARKNAVLYLPIVSRLDPTLKLDEELLSSIQKTTSKYDFKEASEYIDDELLQKIAFAGTPEEIINQTFDLFKKGVNRIEYGTPHGLITGKEGIEVLGKEVLPQVREHINERNVS
ncbi:MAG: LLM class flavin-dependent oxidoreductase [Candidatus Hodarchaeales archaeon]